MDTQQDAQMMAGPAPSPQGAAPDAAAATVAGAPGGGAPAAAPGM